MLPRVATEVVRVSCGATPGANQLSDLIHQDPALAAHVLGVANSPAYLPVKPIVSLQEAVVRIGSVALGEIALAASLQNGIFEVGAHETELERLWEHAIASGSWAREIARHTSAEVENAFLCGLLHGIGKPAVLQLAANAEADRGKWISAPDLVALIDEFHQPIGASLAERWDLPSSVQEALAGYRSVGSAEPGSQSTEAVVTAAAGALATHMLEPNRLDEETLRAHPAFAAMNLSSEEISALLERRQAVAALVESMTA